MWFNEIHNSCLLKLATRLSSNMSRFLQFDKVAFSYPGMAELLLGGITAHFPEGAWTGIVGANGHGEVDAGRV